MPTTIGWGSGHQRPTPGLRVRVIPSLRDRGVGTVLKVHAVKGGGVQPACRVKWDDGSLCEYFSGMTISRAALARAVHPHYDSSELERWVETMGWGANGEQVLSSHSIREILAMNTSTLQTLIEPYTPMDDEQTAKLHAFCHQALARAPVTSSPRLYCHTQGMGHDFKWQGTSGSSLPLQLACASSHTHTIAHTKVTGGSARGGLSRTHPHTSRTILAMHNTGARA
mmetsp:Transcript_54289/g.79609  ORF Transcript_54289/g.79609 Transcript_54289/m.79609 type:complete len:226 (-) Transcript_54289:21-698(-)